MEKNAGETLFIKLERRNGRIVIANVKWAKSEGYWLLLVRIKSECIEQMDSLHKITSSFQIMLICNIAPIVWLFHSILDIYMATIRKTITLTDKQDQWIKTQIAAGGFTNDSEYIRDLVRRDQEQNAQYMALKQAIQEGLNSGVSDKTVGEIWEEAEQRSKNKRG